MKVKTNKKGFTLVELLVVIAIIGILAAILIPNMIGFIRDSKISTANANAKTVHSSATAYVTKQLTTGGTKATSASGTDCAEPLTKYLDANFKGNWYFDVTETGDSVNFALWSDSDVECGNTQLSADDQEDLESDEIVGCYPLAKSSGGSKSKD